MEKLNNITISEIIAHSPNRGVFKFKDRETDLYWGNQLMLPVNQTKTALCAIAKNENRYIREWIEHYKNLGIKHIYLYDNNELDGEHFEDVIGDYIDSDFITVIDVRGVQKGLVYDKNGLNLQPRCYKECYEKYGYSYDYMCFFDIDEFLELKNGITLSDYLTSEKIKAYDTILVPWEIYDDNGQIFYENRPVQERFTTVSTINKSHPVKSILKTCKKLYSNISVDKSHFMLTNGLSVCWSDGTLGPDFTKHTWYSMPEENFKKSVIKLKHYRTKSFEEFYIRHYNEYWGTKCGNFNSTSQKYFCVDDIIENYYHDNERNKEKDTNINSFLQTKKGNETNDVTFIIPNRGGEHVNYVIKNFTNTFKKYFNKINFIVINQVDETSFKRGQLFNIAFRYVNTKWLGLIDNDIVNLNSFNPIKKYEENGCPIACFDHISQVHLENNKTIVDSTRKSITGFGAFNFMKKEDFGHINGFSNLTFGWGAEDNIFAEKLQMVRISNTIGHISHQPRYNINPILLCLNRDVRQKYRDKKMNYKLDGMVQTTYDIAKINQTNNVLFLDVTNIGVPDNFKYKEIFLELKKYEDCTNTAIPGISICVTAYKAEKYIKETLDSIYRQTWFKNHDNWEIIIGVDDCKDTLQYLQLIRHDYDEHLRIFMMSSNKGTYVTTNTIMCLAKYDALFRFDSDDIMLPQCIETVMNNLTDVDFLRFNMENFTDFKSDINHKQVQITFGVHVIKKNIFLKYGGYKPWPCSADTEIIERLKNVANFKILTDVLLKRRIHNDSLTHKPGPNQLYGGIGSERQKYLNYCYNMNVTSEKDATIICVTNTFTEIDKNYEINDFCTNSYSNLIVTLTSWKKRIMNIPTVLSTVLNQTKSINKIVLNLSVEEFPNKDNDLPENVLKFIKTHNIIEINWINGKNTKQWKKIIPTMQKYPNDWIICIDDDKLYPKEFIETLWSTHLLYPNNPITLNKTYKIHGCLQHSGVGTLECAKFYNNFENVDIEYIQNNTESSDTVFTYLLNRNGYELKPISSQLLLTSYNEIDPLSEKLHTCNAITHNTTWDLLSHRYGQINTQEYLSNKRVNVCHSTIAQPELSKKRVNIDLYNQHTMNIKNKLKRKTLNI